ncbi:probable mediator of RNA polymerase II transcription subunit 26c isoform X2 [Solanum dulcamara]|uniref:probable mediator of RNA polymerase II transcription subunit 26c isoform X2 n=1 Tax=Solanum dulcamara TaxID=45834 RepID=UPI002486616C|nr:probable mediator of RNA polymerase II transcription subunit 26c isoform X2 [Solanum dulcamara]
MDLDEFRLILSESKVDVWTMIDTAISVAAVDCADELKHRRDGIVEKLYSTRSRSSDDVVSGQHRLDNGERGTRNVEMMMNKSPLTPESNHRENDNSNEKNEEEEDVDPYGGLFDDDEQTQILSIKEQLEDPQLSDEDVFDLLQNLADMDITFQALKETDIGRHVNRLRKHPSSEVKRLVKMLVRKWKETVDDWVRLNQPEQNGSANLIAADGDSPQQSVPKNQQNGNHQVPDFAYSPNPRNGSSSSDRNNSESEYKPKPVPQRNVTPTRPLQSAPKPASAPPPSRAPPRESAIDIEKLNSARRRLQENYQEAQNAKKQRTIQVMDIHEIPKPKNGFFAKNKGGFQGRHHR